MTKPSDSPPLSRRGFLGASTVALGSMALARAAAAAQKPARPGKADAGDPFPKDFQWGVATAAYQIEGAAAEDGRGPSVWDVFSHKEGKTFEGHTGDVACDHYHRFKDDVALMKTLGVKSYRFSISWPRVLPKGVGAANQKGLDFYDRLLDALHAASITPVCTLFHWDTPQALEDKGGWRNREMPDWFGEYTTVVARRYGDRVKSWITHNEPQAFIGNAYLNGEFAPGEKCKYSEYLTAAHHQMMAHGRAVQALRATVKDARVGYTSATQVFRPVSDKPEDVEAARYMMHAIRYRHPWMNSWWMDPILLGKYPEDGIKLYGKDFPSFKASDFDVMKQPLDYLGLNIYACELARMGADGKPEVIKWPAGYPRGISIWQPIAPDNMYWGPRFMYERYKLPMMITENGLSVRDQIFLDGKVHDAQRVDYIHRVLLQLSRGIKEGLPVQGYFYWSLLDNFEWIEGYKERFGIVYVDYATQKRIPKDSFEFYRKVIATGGKSLLGKTVMGSAQLTP